MNEGRRIGCDGGERKEEEVALLCVEVVVARGGRLGGESTERGREKGWSVVDG